MEKTIDKLRALSRTSESTMATLETVLVSIVGRLACWLAPIPSALLVSRASKEIFSLSLVEGLIIAVVIEMVGLVTSNLWLTFKEWNTTKLKSEAGANENLALGLMMGYFVISFLLLLGMELPTVINEGKVQNLIALSFPGLSAIGVISLNQRVTHFHRVNEAEREAEERARRRKERSESREMKKAQRKAEEAERKAKEAEEKAKEAQRKIEKAERKVEDAQRKKQEVRKALMETLGTEKETLGYYMENPSAPQSQAAESIGVTPRTIRNHLQILEESKIIKKNGDGIEILI
jgi:flagellar biosynthesis GTPase FlhF